MHLLDVDSDSIEVPFNVLGDLEIAVEECESFLLV